METKNERWPLLTFKEYEKDINPSPTYQRSAVWKPGQKQLLMDSILRKIDIPKLYLRETNSNGFTYEIIDGQQRMRALWEFLSNKYPLSEEAENILVGDKLFDVAEFTYEQLPPRLKVERIHKYTLDVVIIQQATEDEIADLFYRLNNGTPLKPAEVRNAMPGEMTETGVTGGPPGVSRQARLGDSRLTGRDADEVYAVLGQCGLDESHPSRRIDTRLGHEASAAHRRVAIACRSAPCDP